MARKIALTVLALIAVVGVLATVKGLQVSALSAHAASFAPPPEAVGVAPVRVDHWQSTVSAVASVVAVQGVTVSAEGAGVVRKIAFESGARVRRGALLIEIDQASERAELVAAQARAELARVNLARTRQLLDVGARAEADLDAAEADAEDARSQVHGLAASVAKKSARAPFAGRLGIRQVSLGQYVSEGQPLVSLQSFDPIYVDLSLPQQWLARLSTGQAVQVGSDALGDERMTGMLTTIDPEVNPTTRNVRLRATLRNPHGRLRSGMFVDAQVVFPEQRRVLIIPATAVIYAPYGDSVFVVEKTRDRRGRTRRVARQRFVRLGETRGEAVAVSSGLSDGELVVSSGAFKLQDGSEVDVRDERAPDPETEPGPMTP
jgi:membrane fusion protein, multidrug efflux system